MPSSSYARRPVSLTVWLTAVVIMIVAVFAAVRLSGNQSPNNVELSSSRTKAAAQPCATASKKIGPWSKTGTYRDHGATAHHGDGMDPAPVCAATTTAADASASPSAGASATVAPVPPTTAPLEILAKDCSKSQLPAHDGFQNGGRCVSTEFGEVATQEQDPSLLISKAPRQVRVGQTFTISVNTRNLVRDRFLAAGKGGYYVESSLLNADGLVRGHFHTACRMLTSTTTAPDPAPVPAFFVATEDGKGSATPDTVTVTVAGLPTSGLAQCAVWAGDGSHRIPMMQRANQTPAFDVVRIRVR
jgi:hypothetical protein